jgi:hypothetical protein
MLKKLIALTLAVIGLSAHAECTKTDIAKVVAAGVAVTAVVTPVVTAGVLATMTVMVEGSPTVLVYIASGAASPAFVTGVLSSVMPIVAILPATFSGLVGYDYIQSGCKKVWK